MSFYYSFPSFLYVRGQKTGCLSVAQPKIRKTTITAWHGSNKKLSIPIKIKLRWGRIYCRVLVIDCINELIARCTLICFNFYRHTSTSPHISCLLCLVDWRHSWGAGAAFLLDDVMRVWKFDATVAGSCPEKMKSPIHSGETHIIWLLRLYGIL